eukprot:m.57458 g.57458  ORF g.57458 m.57458 type:complete len:103 (-) comp9353_c0_seq4:995-1303(-)
MLRAVAQNTAHVTNKSPRFSQAANCHLHRRHPSLRMQQRCSRQEKQGKSSTLVDLTQTFSSAPTPRYPCIRVPSIALAGDNITLNAFAVGLEDDICAASTSF